jgi:hypothetical protein
MYRHVFVRVASIILVCTVSLPLLAAPPSPFESVISKIVRQIRHIFVPTPTDDIGFPKP